MSIFDFCLFYGGVSFIFILLVCAKFSYQKANKKPNNIDGELQKFILKETNELNQAISTNNSQVEDNLKEAG